MNFQPLPLQKIVCYMECVKCKKMKENHNVLACGHIHCKRCNKNMKKCYTCDRNIQVLPKPLALQDVLCRMECKCCQKIKKKHFILPCGCYHCTRCTNEDMNECFSCGHEISEDSSEDENSENSEDENSDDSSCAGCRFNIESDEDETTDSEASDSD